jgi:multiple sugar transport system ATP-binding protein
MAEVRLKNLTKRFGSQSAVQGLELQVDSGEFLVIVGPSGCGKSTTLRLIAGLEQPTSGRIELNGRDITDIPPWKRQVAMVFQNQALYPHLSVQDNLAFGLRRLGWRRAERRRRVEQTAELLGITPLLGRQTAELSGGERQRVAVGRAIARPAELYLFDEPLSSLDPPVRETLRAELATLQQTLEATFLYVTHDQLEAMSLGQRLAILQNGQLQQMGEPLELYQHPRNQFVAEFLGTTRLEVGLARVETEGDSVALAGEGLRIELPAALAELLRKYRGSDVMWGVRAEDVFCSSASEAEDVYGRLESESEDVYGRSESEGEGGSAHRGASSPHVQLLVGKVERLQHRGYDTLITSSVGTGTRRQTSRVSTIPPRIGGRVRLTFDVNRLLLFDPTTGKSLRRGGIEG